MADRAGPEASGRLLTSLPDEGLGELAARLQGLALRQGLTVGTAESCTGGLVGATITSIAGASAFYLGGVISYADDVKRDLLEVSPEALVQHGAVSAQVALAMADGLRARLGCDMAVSVTGVAGPDGGTQTKPVGLTYVAVSGPHGHQVERHTWTGDRIENQRSSAAAALSLLLVILEQGEA